MSTINDGGPAFPLDDGVHRGASLRDYFAVEALPGLIVRRWEDAAGNVPANIYDLWARAAYATADAMLKARAQGAAPLDSQEKKS